MTPEPIQQIQTEENPLLKEGEIKEIAQTGEKIHIKPRYQQKIKSHKINLLFYLNIILIKNT